jgi:hypothetical protein
VRDATADRLFALFFVATAGLRLTLAATTQAPLHGDEATVGIMALRLLERGEWPLTALNAPYNGGAALLAWLGAAVLGVTGPSEAALTTVGAVVSLVSLLVVHRLVRTACGAPAALCAAVVYGTTASLLRWSFDVRGGYLEGQLVAALVFLALPGVRRRPRWPAELGVAALCGFGYYLLPAFAAVAVVALAFLARRHGARAALRAPAWVAAFALGALPAWFAQAPAPPSGLRPLSGVPRAFWATLTRWLPSAQAPDNLYGNPAIAVAPNLLETAFFALALGALAVWGRRPRGPGEGAPPLTALLGAHVGVFLVLFALHPDAGSSARYLLFLEPSLSILAGLGVHAALRRGGAASTAAAALLAVTLADRAREAARVARDETIHGISGRGAPGTAPAVLAALEGAGIRHAMIEDWDVRWRVAFLSGDRAQTHHFSRRWFREPPEPVRAQPRFGIVVAAEGGTEDWLRPELEARGVARVRAGEMALYVCEAAARCGEPPALTAASASAEREGRRPSPR